jgi:hypothetical protein
MEAENQEGIGLSYRPASLCSLATQILTRFLELIPRPIAGLKFPTQIIPTVKGINWKRPTAFCCRLLLLTVVDYTVHPQNVRLQNVKFKNILFQNVRFQNAGFTKRQFYKTSGFKTSGFKTSGFKTSIEIKASKDSVFKFDILIKQKV